MKDNWSDNFYSSTDPIDRLTDSTLYNEVDRITAEIEITKAILGNLSYQPKRILNLACGPNVTHSLLLCRKYRPVNILNLDSSKAFVDTAHEAWDGQLKTKSIIDFKIGDMRNLEIKANSFDLVVMYGNSFGYFEHSANQNIFKQLKRILVCNGILLLTVPDYSVATTFSRYKPQVWCNESVVEGKVIVADSKRYFDKKSQYSICETKYYDEESKKVIRQTKRRVAIYPIKTELIKQEWSLVEMARQEGLRLVEDVKLPPFEQTFGLMKNLILVCFSA
jgi:SAM-dependent methyltransferase